MKTTIVLTLAFLYLSGNAQSLPLLSTYDTIPGTDSLIGDLKTEVLEQLPVISLNEGDPDEGSNSTVSSVLSAGRNPFLAAVAFRFSPVRFRLRGYNNGDAVYLNGADLTGLDNGFAPFGLWSGLTNMMRSRQNACGLEAADFAPNRLGLHINIDMRAGVQWAQTQAGYALSNRNYRHRFLLTHGSGFNKNGWAYSFMLSTRYAKEGYVPGTYYRSLSYYAAIDKKAGARNVFSFIAFGAPTESGRQTASVQEAMDLAGTHFYNPSWGYQNGEKRNAAGTTAFQPVFMGVYEYKPNIKTSWMTTLAYIFGKRKLSGFDWYNAPDPRPDYYRYLPGYYAKTQPDAAAALRALIAGDPGLLQVNWNRLYEVNRANRVTIRNVGGVPGEDVSGNRSLYILSNRVNTLQRYVASTVYRSKLSGRIGLAAGAGYQRQENEHYQEVKDLLGGDFWLNVNQFAERDFPNDAGAVQYDLDHPDQLKKEGAPYGYHYRMTMSRITAWAQLMFTGRRLDGFLSINAVQTQFYRQGLNRNGLFPDDSYGPSARQQFIDPGIKTGITYKRNGRNYFFISGGYFRTPPLFDNVFIAPRTRNALQPDPLKSETFWSAETGYKHNSPRLRIGLTGYYTAIRDVYDVMTFYHDQYRNFVNYAMSGIHTVHFGGEMGAEIKLNAAWSLNGVASVGRYYYNGRPHAIVTVDNDAAVLTEQVVYLKNFRVPSTPQNAYSAGFFYRSPRYWFFSLSGNYFGQSWLSVNPIRRTIAAIGDADPASSDVQERINRMTVQEKFPAQFTLDLFAGWSKRLRYTIHKKPVYLVFSLGVNNLLNNKDIRSGGFEQLRFNMEDKDPDSFPPKYYYAYGLNYYASLMLRFK
ncbi:TonB-dependent receptor [Niabella sp. CC-SYL272]|uniref:TonB-dependent receptor n=1 Tax=Niabella agricola TaxID=2891571 RepID=UPI001F19BFED|nr:TonB-dependent receptor [Niabella agricola]MCF3110871.1 TonB-dependent receptor [Niabella agricola]